MCFYLLSLSVFKNFGYIVSVNLSVVFLYQLLLTFLFIDFIDKPGGIAHRGRFFVSMFSKDY